jgi:hypothetical protein
MGYGSYISLFFCNAIITIRGGHLNSILFFNEAYFSKIYIEGYMPEVLAEPIN